MFSITSILTNGYLLSQDIVDLLSPYRDKLVFGISLDSHRPDEHDRRCCVKGAFNKVIENIQKLTSAGFKVRISMAVDEDNWDDLESTLILSKKLGAMAFTYSSIVPFGRGKHQNDGFQFWKRDSRVIYEFEKMIHKKYSGFLHKLDSSQLERLSKRGGCGAGHRSYAMDPNGNIRLCVTYNAHDAIIGNLVDQSLEDVFSNKLCELSAEIMAPSIDICAPCQYTIFCSACALRGSYALGLVGKENCKWAQIDEVDQWLNLIQAK
jgi:radical SAM protein with 4Fe4S-binding SPASM domain